jgi:hypothetical protein
MPLMVCSDVCSYTCVPVYAANFVQESRYATKTILVSATAICWNYINGVFRCVFLRVFLCMPQTILCLQPQYVGYGPKSEIINPKLNPKP